MNKTAKVKIDGFTLIELLVVISIIAILMAIMMPALTRARDLAKRTVCSSNSRTIGFAIVQFANDNNDWLPMFDGGRFAGSQYESMYPHRDKWYIEIAKYLDYGNNEPYFTYDRPHLAAQAGVDAPSSLSCPAISSADTNGTIALGFGWNWTAAGYVHKDFSGNWWKPRKLSQINNPSTSALCGENRWDEPMKKYQGQWAWGNSYAGAAPNEYYYPIRHNGGGHYMAADGHIEFASYEDLFRDFVQNGPITRIRPTRR